MVTDSVISWLILTCIVLGGFILFVILAEREQERYRREDEEFWKNRGQ